MAEDLGENGYESKGKYVVLSVTTLAQFMAAIDATIIFLAVPSMGRYFNTNASYMTMVVVAYIISTTSLLIPSGAIGQRLGRKAPFLMGFGIFSLSSLGIALSPSILWAIIFRAIEGSGAALMLTLGIPILLRAFPPEERGKAVGISATSWSIGALLGPIVGGYLVSFAWQYIFLINVPIGFVAIIMGIYRVPKEKGLSTVKINKLNAAGFLLFLVPLVIGIAFLNIYWLVVALVMLPVFLLTQKNHPLVPVELFSNKKYYPIILSAALQGVGFMGILYVLSVFFQSDLGLSSIEAGLALSAFPAASILGTPLGGYLLDKTGRGGSLMFLSIALQGIAILMMAFFLRDIHTMIIPLLLAGFGGSIFWSVSTTLSVDVAGDNLRNMASGTLFTVRNGALIVGIALLPVFISLFSNSSVSGSLLIFGSGVNIFDPVRAYVIFLSSLSAVASGILLFTRNRWDIMRKKATETSDSVSES